MNNDLKPKIRFKGFTDDWEQRKLKDLVTYRRGSFPQPYGKEEWYGGNGSLPFVQVADVGENLKLNNITKQTISKLAQPMSVFIPKNSVVVTLQGTIGRVAITQYNAYLDRTILFFDTYKKTGINKYFWAITIKNKFEEERKKAPGAVIKTITKEVLSNFDISIANCEEQQKIGFLFESIDNLITLHQRKCDKLEELKKSLLEKMFPQNNSLIPKIRFKGFTDDWEQRKFGSCVTIQRGGSPRPIEAYLTTTDKKGVNWVKIGDVKPGERYIYKTAEKIIPEGVKHSREVYKGDLILSNSMSFGRPYIMGTNGCIHDGWLLIRDDKNLFDKEYLLQLLSSNYMLHQYKQLASGGVVNNLNSELVKNTMILIPNKSEQNELGEVFKCIDNLITLHQHKHDKLNKIKQSLLNDMFVQKGDSYGWSK